MLNRVFELREEVKFNGCWKQGGYVICLNKEGFEAPLTNLADIFEALIEL